MNNPLLQKASIVFSPTAYGTGTLNSIKPVQSFGSELVTNGTFDTDSNWTKNNATISGGKANFNIVGGAYAKLQQSITYVTGRKYRLTAVVNGTNGKAMRFRDDTANAGGLTSSNGNLTMTGSDQLVTFEWTANANSDEIAIERHTTSGDYTFTVDNVSIKEIIDADFGFDRNTTATRVNESELIETVVAKVPRINYTSKVGCVLFEPQMTNHYLKSEAFDNFQGTIALNNATSPTGVTNAAKLTKTSASDQFLNLSWSGTTISTSQAYTMSLFVKHNGDDIDVRYEYNNSSDWGVTWTALFLVRASGTTASTVANCTSKVENFGNGWYRISCSFTSASSVTATSPANLVRITGGDTETILVFGAQMEKYAAPTSYISTSGSAVTRSADSANNAGNSDLINSSEGVLYAEIAALADDGTFRLLSVSDGTNNNTVKLGYRSDSNNIYYEVRVGGSATAFQLYSTSDITQFHKVAVKYKVNDFAMWVNGTQVLTDTSGAVPTGLSSVQFTRGDSDSIFYGKVKVLAVFKEALTDAELTTLTS